MAVTRHDISEYPTSSVVMRVLEHGRRVGNVYAERHLCSAIATEKHRYTVTNYVPANANLESNISLDTTFIRPDGYIQVRDMWNAVVYIECFNGFRLAGLRRLSSSSTPSAHFLMMEKGIGNALAMLP